jgi:hypothetical protein
MKKAVSTQRSAFSQTRLAGAVAIKMGAPVIKHKADR